MDESLNQGRPTQEAPNDAEARRNVVAHRERVVRRLLLAGISAGLLRLLLPEWSALIATVAGPSQHLAEVTTAEA